MPQFINTNVPSINTQRQLYNSQQSLTTALQRLSSGLRVNTAKDDAAGLAISNRLSVQIRGLNVAVRNANDGISLAQTTESALDEVSTALMRMRDLAVQAANDTNSAFNRHSLQAEVDQLVSEISRISKTTTFNGRPVLAGDNNYLSFQVGANSNESISLHSVDARVSSLGAQKGVLESTGARVAIEPEPVGSQGIAEYTGSIEISSLIISTKSTRDGDAVDITSREHGGAISTPTTFELIDQNSDSYGSGGAKLIADRINKIRYDGAEGLQGIYASASTSFQALDIIPGDIAATIDQSFGTAIGKGSLKNGDLVINGVDIPPTNFSASDKDGALIKAINAKAELTGVVATVSNNGGLQLNADDGRDIVIQTSTIQVTNDLFGGGYTQPTNRFDSTFNNLRITGRVTIAAEDTILFQGASVFRSGLVTEPNTGTSTTRTTGDRAPLGGFIFGNPGIQENAGSIVIGVDPSDPSYISPSLTLRTISSSPADAVDLSNPPINSISTNSLTNPNASDYGSGLSKVIASRINAYRDSGVPQLLNIYAEATTSFRASEVESDDYSGLVTFPPAPTYISVANGSVNFGDLQINGISVPGASFLDNDSEGTLTSAINSIASSTGVNASIAGNGELELTASDGRDIVISTSSVNVTNTIFANGTNRFTAPFSNLRTAGQLSVYSDESVIFEGLEITAAGLDSTVETNISNLSVADHQVQSNVQAIGTIEYADVTTIASANMLMQSVDSALNQIGQLRGDLGAIQNRFESTIRSLSSVSESLSEAKSRILDADYARETAELSKAQVVQQSGLAMLAQANASPQQVLDLLG